MARKISDRQLKAIDFYFENGFRKMDALRDAGYAESTVRDRCTSFFEQGVVAKEIARRKRNTMRKYKLTQEWLIERFINMVTAGERLAKYKVVDAEGNLGWDFTGAPQEDLALISELSVDSYTDGKGKEAKEIKKFRIKYPDEHAALIALGRYLGMFTDKVEVTGDLAARIQAGRKRAYGDPVPTEQDDEKPDQDTVH